MPDHLKSQYSELKKLAARGLGESAVADVVCEMAADARELLGHAERVKFTSMVIGKSYFGYRAEEESRPINDALWAADGSEFELCLKSVRGGFGGAAPDRITKSVYSIAYAVFAANDVYSVGRKASATFFEILIGHIVSRAIGTEPRKKVKIPESGEYLLISFLTPENASGRFTFP